MQFSTVKYYGSGRFHFPPFRIYMPTAIAIVWTEYGFGIAADGRHCEEGSNAILSDNVQKIFPVDLPGKQLACMIAGIIQINGVSETGETVTIFDFAQALPQALMRVSATMGPSLWHFAHALGNELLQQLTASIASLKDPRDSITQILLAGYYKGPECVAIKLTISALPEAPRYEVNRSELEKDVPIPCGSKAILQRLLGYDEDELFAKYRPAASSGYKTITGAVEMAKNAVLAHYDSTIRTLDPETCARIGGQIHVATVTRSDGFQWVEPPITPSQAL